MRRALLLSSLVLLAPAVDAATPVEFATPAQFTGRVTLENATWALLVFPGEDWSLEAGLEGPVRLEEYRYQAVNRPRLTGPPTEVRAEWSEPREHETHGPDVRVLPTEPWGSAFVLADAVEVVSNDTTLSLVNSIQYLKPRSPMASSQVPDHSFRRQPTQQDQPLLAGAASTVPSVQVRVEGLHALEVRGASATCGGIPCAHSELEERHDGLVQRTTSWRWTSAGGSLVASGRDAVVLAGGTGVDVMASGSIRLPNLRTAADLEQLGVSVQGQTLRGAGSLSLSDIHTRPDRTVRGHLSTDLAAARLDEAPLLVPATASLSAVATLTLLGLLAWKGKALASFLGGLFTRLDMDSALAHPNRRALFDYIDENPGATFRELLRATGMAAGTARHHIAVLTRCDVLIERPFMQTLRYFHCDQAQVGDWDAVVVLRQPELDRMYRWLLDHPDVMQREILDEAEAWGWCRSTAQHRLKRLVDSGLAVVRDLGRAKSYRARVVDIR